MNRLAGLAVAVTIAVVSSGAAAHRGGSRVDIQVGTGWAPWWFIVPLLLAASVESATPRPAEPDLPLIIEPTRPQAYFWYFCRPANAYYPYAQTCPEPWEKVSAEPGNTR